jgi:hypothetical protein
MTLFDADLMFAWRPARVPPKYRSSRSSPRWLTSKLWSRGISAAALAASSSVGCCVARVELATIVSTATAARRRRIGWPF